MFGSMVVKRLAKNPPHTGDKGTQGEGQHLVAEEPHTIASAAILPPYGFKRQPIAEWIRRDTTTKVSRANPNSTINRYRQVSLSNPGLHWSRTDISDHNV